MANQGKPVAEFFYEHVCSLAPDCSFGLETYDISDKEFEYISTDLEFPEAVTSSWTQFVSYPISGCSYTYSLLNANGGSVPSYYNID